MNMETQNCGVMMVGVDQVIHYRMDNCPNVILIPRFHAAPHLNGAVTLGSIVIDYAKETHNQSTIQHGFRE